MHDDLCIKRSAFPKRTDSKCIRTAGLSVRQCGSTRFYVVVFELLGWQEGEFDTPGWGNLNVDATPKEFICASDQLASSELRTVL